MDDKPEEKPEEKRFKYSDDHMTRAHYLIKKRKKRKAARKEEG